MAAYLQAKFSSKTTLECFMQQILSACPYIQSEGDTYEYRYKKILEAIAIWEAEGNPPSNPDVLFNDILYCKEHPSVRIRLALENTNSLIGDIRTTGMLVSDSESTIEDIESDENVNHFLSSLKNLVVDLKTEIG